MNTIQHRYQHMPCLMRQLAYLVTATLLIVACSDKPALDPALIDVYADVVVTRESTLDTARAQADVRAVLQRHGYTAERFEQELRDAGSNPTTFRMLYDSVSARISAKRRAIQK